MITAEQRSLAGKALLGITRPNRGSAMMPTRNPQAPWEGNHSPARFYNRVRMRVSGPDEHGNIVQKQLTPWVYNIANTYGLDSLAQMIGSGAAKTASNWISACRIGTGTTAATSTDTSLVASTASVVITQASFTNTYLGARTLAYLATFASNNPAGAASISEVALYCDSTATANNLAARSVLTGASSVNKGASDVIDMTYQLVLVTA
jgi:hypothetical protein